MRIAEDAIIVAIKQCGLVESNFVSCLNELKGSQLISANDPYLANMPTENITNPAERSYYSRLIAVGLCRMLDSECIDKLIDPIDMEENDFGDNLTYYEMALENIYTLIK